MKLWVKHWVTLRSRRFGLRLEEAPFLLFSIDKATLGEKEIPVVAKPEFRHWMSNVFMYLMPATAEVDSVLEGDSNSRQRTGKGLVHGWELKLGMPVEEAKQVVNNLMRAIEACEKRREERHKQKEN